MQSMATDGFELPGIEDLQESLLIKASDLVKFDGKDLFDRDGKYIPYHKLKRSAKAGLTSVDIEVKTMYYGKRRFDSSHVIRYKFADPIPALQKVARYLSAVLPKKDKNSGQMLTKDEAKARIRATLGG
jgi:hypothetical protein